MKANKKALIEMANPPIASRLVMFEDPILSQQIQSDLRMDIALEGIDPKGVEVMPQMCGRYSPEEDRLINLTGSGTIVQIIYNEEPLGSLIYVPYGWSHGFRFGPASSMLTILDTVGKRPAGYHNELYSGQPDVYD